jgi:Mor family transcriptional regulator
VLKMSSSDKRKHKAEIITKLDKGDKLIDLSKEYGVGRATIYDIRKNREISSDFFQQSVVFANPAVPWSHMCRITKIVLYY